MGLGLGPSGLIRLAVLAGLGLSLLLSGCASTASQTAQNTPEEKTWGQCDRSRIVNITFVCYQR
jgi:outer membrane biogenesis lipoprotein LolB